MNAKAGIPASGMILGLSNADYHSLPSVSSSMLKTILRSPAHYKAAYLSGAPRKEPTASMVLGSLTHTLFLEPEQFNGEYIIAPAWDARTKEGKAVRDAFLAAAEGKTVITRAARHRPDDGKSPSRPRHQRSHDRRPCRGQHLLDRRPDRPRLPDQARLSHCAERCLAHRRSST